MLTCALLTTSYLPKANISTTDKDLAARLPELMTLRADLYSKDFRKIIAEITGCDDLTDRVDMAASAYGQRCHLLTHDDVIGTRAVSFIIYLPDDDWTAADGGALELYNLTPESHNISATSGNPQGLPGAMPSKSLVPKFNTMMVFGVAPGRSYHSVQEVFTDRSPRLSIQGWYVWCSTWGRCMGRKLIHSVGEVFLF